MPSDAGRSRPIHSFRMATTTARDPSKYGDVGPKFGLALARMIAHITYLSEASIERKFGRDLQHSDQLAYDLQRETEFKIESYLDYQGRRFIERFDANSYLYLTRAMDYFDLSQRYGSLQKALGRTNARFLITSYNTDWLFPSSQSREIVKTLVEMRRHVTYLELESVFGHDSFLIEIEQLEELMRPLLSETYRRSALNSRRCHARIIVDTVMEPLSSNSTEIEPVLSARRTSSRLAMVRLLC